MHQGKKKGHEESFLTPTPEVPQVFFSNNLHA